RPVHMVSWSDCREFIQAAAARRIALRLPTEAEWEYACRAGTVTAYPWAGEPSQDYAWTMENYGASRTLPGLGVLVAGADEPPKVGEKMPNLWGLYDMCGLVWEWCGDWYAICYDPDPLADPKGPTEGEYRVVRGGSISSPVSRACASARESWRPDSRLPHVGFRCAIDADPGEPAQPETVEGLLDYAEQLRANTYAAGAGWFCSRAALKVEKELGPDHPGTVKYLGMIAAVFDNLHEYGRAEELYRRALELAEAAAPESAMVVGLLGELGYMLARQGLYNSAEPLLRRALAIVEKSGQENREAAVALNSLAIVLQGRGDPKSAIPLFRRAFELSERVLGRDDVQTFVCVSALGSALLDHGDFGGAEPLIRRRLDLLERVLGGEHEDTLDALSDLARALLGKGDLAGAEQALRSLLERQKAVFGPDHRKLAETLLRLVDVAKAQGDHEGAVVLAWRAKRIRDKT
ncbi:MAG: tetratricopeptide repeat protein, partial [Planctomycetota bacterium]|nr:tetratricopeptide repeat protein [Planctomycetota bacterium]